MLASFVYCSLLSLLVGIASADLTSPPKVPPSFADSFEVAYNFSLPYVKFVQKDGLVYPVHIWRDADNQMMRQDTYNGVNSMIITKGYSLEVTPRVDKLYCRAFGRSFNTDFHLAAPVLPDLSSWQYVGETELHGRLVNLWQKNDRHGAKLAQYNFYVTEDGLPVRMHMHGQDMFSGSHYDTYIADYHVYRPGPPDPAVFKRPTECNGVPDEATTGNLSPLAVQMASLLPAMPLPGDHAEYNEFSLTHGRVHRTAEEYRLRLGVYQDNSRLITETNNRNASYRLTFNRFADWTQEEFEAVAMGRKKQRVGKDKPGKAEIPYERRVRKGRLPQQVSWQGTPADGVVKDQATCGSCWAFGTTGALHAAHYLATGEDVRFSEQQFVDCSWGFGLNQACEGGDFGQAIEWMVTKNDGWAVQENDWEYLGADGYCTPHKGTAKFKGYTHVPEYDEEAVMEAVYSRGPVAVSIDAAAPGFRFYASGTVL
eukprot:jgi/Botrbrau1/9588/Bobra.106_2s0011.2